MIVVGFVVWLLLLTSLALPIQFYLWFGDPYLHGLWFGDWTIREAAPDWILSLAVPLLPSRTLFPSGLLLTLLSCDISPYSYLSPASSGVTACLFSLVS